MKIITLCIMLSFMFTSNGNAWENRVTHQTLSEIAAETYFGVEFMDMSINGKRSRIWIREGSKLEDEGEFSQFLNGTARSLNHFHAPNRLVTSVLTHEILS